MHNGESLSPAMTLPPFPLCEEHILFNNRQPKKLVMPKLSLYHVWLFRLLNVDCLKFIFLAGGGVIIVLP